jgi:hypothetical protein
MSEMGPFACAADSPDGQIAHACHAQIARRANLSQPDGIAVTPKSAADFAPSRPHQEGRFAIVTNVGSGMRWTRWRRKTSGANADGEVVWSWHPDAGVKFADD